MITINEKHLNNEFLEALEGLKKNKEEVIQIDLSGQKYILLKEQDYHGWLETAYLLSSSKNSEILQRAIEEPMVNCRDIKDVLNELES
jgi:PHD/YefM family antitoxin component YafN of YafNO toxin-antitoxin module